MEIESMQCEARRRDTRDHRRTRARRLLGWCTLLLPAGLLSFACGSTPPVEDPLPPYHLHISPSEVQLPAGTSQLFSAAGPDHSPASVRWSVVEPDGGTIDESGIYTAPIQTGSFTILARSVAIPSVYAEATVQVVEGVTVAISPRMVSLEFEETQRFSAILGGTSKQAVRWAVREPDGGTIDDEGVYRAPAVEGDFHVIATSVEDPSRRDIASVRVRRPVEVRIDGAGVSIAAGDQRTFHAIVSGTSDQRVAWSVLEPGGGSVDAAGTYTAPPYGGTFHVVATSAADPRRSASIGVDVRPAIEIEVSPTQAELAFGEEKKFVAQVHGAEDDRSSWSVSGAGGGTIDGAGVYVAPDVEGIFEVVATSVADPRRSAAARVTVRAPVEVRIEPSIVELEYAEEVQLRAAVSGTPDQRIRWTVVESEGGEINEAGVYRAPARAGVFHVMATSVADPRRSASIEVTVREPVEVRIEPALVELEFGDEAVFHVTVGGSDDQRVRWSVSEARGGSVDASGSYRAPNVEGTFHVVATSVADPRRQASARVVVRAPIEVRVDPSHISLEFGEEFTFSAVISGTDDHRVLWSVEEPDGGEIDSAGRYRAPDMEGSYRISATSVPSPESSGSSTVVVNPPNPIDLTILPEDRRTAWSPGIPGGIPTRRQRLGQLSGLISDGTGDNAVMIQNAIQKAGELYESSGIVQEIELPEGTFRFTRAISLNRSGVVLRGKGTGTRLRYDGDQAAPAILIGRSRWTDYGSHRGPWALVRDGEKGSRQIVISARDAANVEVGDILGIDEEDDLSFVRMGDGWYGKRQPRPDTHGPALRAEGRWRSVGTMIKISSKHLSEDVATLGLEEPLHMSFRVRLHAQIFHISSPRRGFDEVQYSGLEQLYLTGGTISTNNVSYCWMSELEVDGNPGTPNLGSYTTPGGISGHSVELFHAYRCELRGSYIHHSRNISQGGGSYLVTLSGYTSESLVEDNIVIFGNKLIVANMMGGGNVISYNYVDNARTSSATWQEGAIDLNHLSFSHSALVEGNWATNIGADSTHGNSGWHVFHRNLATGQNSSPIYGAYPYTSGAPDTSFRRAVGVDGYSRETTFIGNVLLAGAGAAIYQVDHLNGPNLAAAAIWRIGGGVDGGGDNLDDGTALSLLYRHGNWDSVSQQVVWTQGTPKRELPASLYLRGKPAFFGGLRWPWVEPQATSEGERVGILPAKARYDKLRQP